MSTLMNTPRRRSASTVREARASRRLALLLGAVLLVALAAAPAFATNGYFSHGYGAEYKALAGAGTALALGPMAAATNPGAMAFVDASYDISLSFFNPNRKYAIEGAPSGVSGTFGLAPGTIESESTLFVVPSLSANWVLNEDETLRLGVAIYGNGGMNTDYPTNTFGGSSPTGVDLAQLFLAPTLSYQLAERHGLGVTPIFAYQSFSADGLEAFSGFSSAPDALTNNGHDSATGFGFRVGYLGQLLDFLSLGLSYQSKMANGQLDDYAGLFAEQGSMDVPATWSVGLALGYAAMGLSFDVQQILYSGVKSISNPLLPNLQEARLGDDEGAGFGWDDMTVFKVGGWYQINSGWMFRLGYSYGSQPIGESEVLFNILAPGVIEQHLSFGVTKDVAEDMALTLFVARAFSNDLSGANPLEVPGQQTITLTMDQWEFGLGFAF